MTVQQHYCDKCGNKISADRSLLLVESGPMQRHRPEIDLCADCCHLLAGWLAAPKFDHHPATAGADPR